MWGMRLTNTGSTSDVEVFKTRDEAVEAAEKVVYEAVTRYGQDPSNIGVWLAELPDLDEEELDGFYIEQPDIVVDWDDVANGVKIERYGYYCD